jgi:hypothetical protein
MSRHDGTFVVGTGRCGSTFVSNCLRLEPSVLSLSEWFAVLGGPVAVAEELQTGAEFWKTLTVPLPDIVSGLKLGVECEGIVVDARYGAMTPPILQAPLPHLTDEPDELLAELREFVLRGTRMPASAHHDRVFEYLTRRTRKTVWIERSGGSLEYVEELHRGWPGAKFVHLWRVGPECAISMSRHPYFRVRVARKVSRNPSLEIAECLGMDIPVDRFGAYWSAMVLRGTTALRGVNPTRVLQLSFEQLLREPKEVLRRLIAFVQGPDDWSRTWLEQASDSVRQVRQRRDDLSASEARRLTRACEPGMRALARFENSLGAQSVGDAHP